MLVCSVTQFSLTECQNSSLCGRNVLLCMRRFQYAFSAIASSILSISVDALVSRYLLNGISDTQWCKSELLIEYCGRCSFISQSDTATLIKHVCMS